MWLLWLVLLLPLAQTAATLHLLSHATADLAGKSGTIDGKLAIEHAQCNLCLTAAALVGAAPPVAPPFLPQSTALHQSPKTVFSSFWPAPAVPAYQSRAPPNPLL